jgi:hypothetical protein
VAVLMTDLEPVDLLWRRGHPFKVRDPKAKMKLCAVCGHGRDHASLVHYGAPPSMNVGGSGHDHGQYQNAKGAWQKMLCELLVTAELPRGLQRVAVEGEIGFDTYADRDEGNFRYFVEKALGDALVSGYWELWPTAKLMKQEAERTAADLPPLVTKNSRAKGKTRVRIYEGGWLPGDSFYPTNRYSFGHLDPVHTPGESHLRLTLFPALETTTVQRAGDQEKLAI